MFFLVLFGSHIHFNSYHFLFLSLFKIAPFLFDKYVAPVSDSPNSAILVVVSWMRCLEGGLLSSVVFVVVIGTERRTHSCLVC